MVSAFSYVLLTRTPLEVDTIRGRGELYTTASNGDIRNTYSVKIANKSQQDMTYTISFEGLDYAELVGATEVRVEAGELYDHTIFIQVDPRALERPNYEIEFEVTAVNDESISATSESRFIGPTP